MRKFNIHMMTFFDKLRDKRKKKPQIPCSSRIFLRSIFWPLKHDFKTKTCNFNLSPWILLEPITILLEIYWNPTKVLMEPVGVLLKHSGVLNWSSAKSLKIASFCWNILKRSEKTDQRNYFELVLCPSLWSNWDSDPLSTANIYDQFTIRLQSFIVSQFPSTVIGSALPLVVL